MGKDVEIDNQDPMETEKDVEMLVVGIGASAGGIQALKTFFANVPKDSGNVYVVILHLSPEFESQLAQVLQTTSAMPVKQVGDRRQKIGPNCVYVIPPNRSLTIADGYLAAKAISSKEDRRAPVDLFFRALAEAHGNRAVGIILTGTGPNGSMGIKRIKEMGGVVVAQDPHQAEYQDMPRNSIATGLVDYILPVERIPAKVAEYKERLNGSEQRGQDESRIDLNERALAEIFVLLRSRTGHDFVNYKRATVLRRIERRMNVCARETLSDYVELLRSDRNETQSLLKDLLISVTNFFRDPNAWKALERSIVPKLCSLRSPHEPIRVWVAGCATGEEAYSFAMLFSERLADRLDAPPLQIFATDIDENAIARARSGLYSESDVADVSPERLRHFFIKEGDDYRVRRELRERVLFAVHNVTKDPPFSRLDLASCRNLLIYLSRPAQVRVLETLHFALKPGGYLFLGTSESADNDENLFVTADKDNRIYESRPIAARIPVQTPDISHSLLSQRIDPIDPARQDDTRVLDRLSYTSLHQNLLEAYAPPSLVVNSEYEIVHLSRNAGRYLQIGGGEPSKNLLDIARPELRLELRSALYQASQRGTTVTVPGLSVNTDAGNETIDLIVRVVVDGQDGNRGFVLVIFAPSIESPRPITEALVAEEPVAKQLEDQLIKTQSQLRSTVEQYEIQHEELKASNEELQAINEELRSAAEEIETSKEELQSSNEELSTVNQELKIKIEELSQSNNDLQNLINSTTVATIFLDRRLRVKLFTQTATRIFNLITADVGRPLSDLKSKLKNLDLIDLAEKVLDDLQPYEKEIEAEPDVWYLMRIVPYRTREDKIDGVVLTFLDISTRLKMEADLKQSQSRLTKAMNIETVGVVFFDNDLRFVDCNETFLKMTGFDRVDITSERFSWDNLVPPEWRDTTKHAIAELGQSGYVTPYEKEYLRRDGSSFFGLFAAARVGENEIVEYVIDISSRKSAEKDLLFKSRLLETVEQSVIATDMNGDVIYWNSGAERLYGWSRAEAIGQNIVRLNTPRTSVQEANEIMNELRDGKSWEGDFEVLRKDGSAVLVHVYDTPLLDDAGNVVGIVGVSTDVGERRRTESSLRDTQDRMRILVESATDYAIFTLSEDGIVTGWSPGAEAIFGYTEKEIIGRSGEIIFIEEDREQGVPEKEMRRARQSGRAEDERWHLRKDGTRFFATGVMQPLRSPSTGYVKICRDQTDILEAETVVRERQMLKRIVRTQEDERRRIARDLHDTLGQQLTALRLKLEAVKANYGAEPAMMKAIDETQLMAKQIDDDISFLNWELRPTALDNLGLRNALGNFVNEWSKNYGVEAEFHSTGRRRVRLAPDIEINLYRIAQEALHNVLKHAKASKADVMLEYGKDTVVLIIEYNGVGFNQKAVSPGKNKGHLGIVGMKERAALLGGKLEIETARSKGTTIIARVPIRKARNVTKNDLEGAA